MVFHILLCGRGGGGDFVVIGGCAEAEDEVGEEMILHQYLVLFLDQPARYKLRASNSNPQYMPRHIHPPSRTGIKSHGVHSTIAIVVTT